MCGRYAASKDTATLVEEFSVEAVVDPAPDPSFNVAPTDQVPMVVDRPVEGEQIQRQLRTARWGLVPSWAKDPKIGARMINARWEEAAEKPAFRAAFAKRRCLLPADGYFEWYVPVARREGQREGQGDGPRDGPRGRRVPKQPYFVHRADGRPLALAGLYEFWRPGPEEPWLVTVSVLTTDSAGAIAPLHDRMPVVIDPAGYAAWLDPTTSLGPDFPGLLAAERLVAHPVGTAVNSVRNNSPDLVAPVDAEGERRLPSASADPSQGSADLGSADPDQGSADQDQGSGASG